LYFCKYASELIILNTEMIKVSGYSAIVDNGAALSTSLHGSQMTLMTAEQMDVNT
jgi:hypothetical protein